MEIVAEAHSKFGGCKKRSEKYIAQQDNTHGLQIFKLNMYRAMFLQPPIVSQEIQVSAKYLKNFHNPTHRFV
jgi:hypothetical protein